jgi:hypothetical protein
MAAATHANTMRLNIDLNIMPPSDGRFGGPSRPDRLRGPSGSF